MDTTPPQIIPGLPKAGDMLERVRAEAAELRSFTITFMSLLLYVAIIISSTSHEQILRIDPVKLPLLNVDIPIVGFFWFMPGFLFFLHLYILLQHYLFSQRAFRFRAALERETDEETKNHLRRSLGNLPFLHWLAGQHGGFMNFLMTAITVVSLIIWPVLTFWWLQAAFLPYHDNGIVWTQRAFLLLDAALLAYLWAKILDDQDDAGRWWKLWLAPFFYGLTKPVKAVVRRAIRWLSRQTWLAVWVSRQWPRRIIDWLRPRFGNGADVPTATPNPVSLAAVLDRWLLAVFLLSMLFLSFMVAAIPDSPEEQWLLARLPDSWITTVPVEQGNRILFDGTYDAAKSFIFESVEQGNRRLFDWTSRLHEQRRITMDDDERNDYDPARISECREENAADKQSKAADEKTANAKPGAKPESPRKCYWIDSPFPRNLILREKLLIANKGLAAEVQAGLSAAVGTTKADDLAKAEGLSLQGRHLEYADLSQSSLPNADLRRARLKVANLSRAKLE
ncbi:MAG: pentapeptide repeat-containing protein [Methylococcales bacterium]|nr:pentapeptide repeat-containing protein [Methylococcales bacterium]